MVHISTELGSAYISVGLGTNKLGPEIRKAFADVDGVAGSAGESAGKSFSGKFSGFMKSAALPAAGLLAGGGILAVQFGQLAATAEQNAGAVNSVFKGMSGDVKEFATSSAANLGISSSEYNQFAAMIGSQFKNAGVPLDQLAGQTNGLITKGADLASMFGGTTTEAVEALSSALKGEMDPIEKYGISLNESAIQGKLAELGLSGLEGEAGRAAKTQAILALVNDQSADATGNFARETGTAAGAQQIATAAWADASAKLGEVLLPIMTAAATKVSEFSKWISENSGLVTGIAIGIGILAVAVLAFSAAMFIANLAMIPGALLIGGIILGIGLLVAAIVLLVMNWDTVVKFITDVWGGFIGWITGVIGGFVGFWNDMWGQVGQFISDVWNNIVSWISDAINNVSNTINSVVSGILAAWNRFWGDVGAKVGEIWESIKTGVSNGIDGVVGFVRDIPGKVLGFFSNAGTLLLNAGGNIIDGFLRGLTQGFEDVKNFVGGIGQWIADNKGPKAYDLALLVPAGGWIMDGLEDGIEGSLPSLRRTLGGVSATIAAGITSPSGAGSYTPAGAYAGAGSGVTYNTTINQVDDPIGTSHAVQRRLGALAV